MLKKLISSVLFFSFLMCSCQRDRITSDYDEPDRFVGVGYVISVELGFFKKEYQEYFRKILKVEKLTEEETNYTNVYDFDEHYKFANITMLWLYSDSEKPKGDTIQIIYPLFSHSGRQSTDIMISKSYAFNAKLLPEKDIQNTTLSGGFKYYLSKETKDILPIYYPVKNYHLHFNDDNINKTVDSILSIVKS
jgi:hypothetical protein